MTTPSFQLQIDKLAALYETLTGFHLDHHGVCNPREQAWFAYVKAGFTGDDLILVVRWLQRRIKDGVRRPESLKFSNLLGDIYRFDEELNLARAQMRNAKARYNAKESVVASLPTVRQGSPVVPMTAKPISVYIEAMRKAAK
jgi:hypothetical protein